MINNVYNMSKKILGILPCLILASTATAAAQPLVMSYWENWATYQQYPMPGNAQGSKNAILSEQITGLNALAYAFLFIGADGSLQFSDVWSDLNPRSEQDKHFCTLSPASCNGFPQNAGLGNFGAFTKTAVQHHFVSVGGGGQDKSFEKAFDHPEKFVSSLKALVEVYHINALDLDYEPVNGVPPASIQRFIELTTQIRAALPSITITYTINSISRNIDKFGAENWKKLGENINYISIMGYDMHGSFDVSYPYTALHSALTSQRKDSSVENAVKALNKAGIANDKIILGMPLYGRAVGGVMQDGIGQIFTEAAKGDGEKNCSTSLSAKNRCEGFIQYKSLVDQLYTPIPVIVDNQLAGVYSYDRESKVFVSYDNPESAAAKAQYVVDNQLGGIMMWAIRFDKPINDSHSILAAIDKVIGLHQLNS